MNKSNRIIIQNIYHMLSYAFRILKQTGYDQLASESFEHIHELFVAILEKGLSKQLKQGLHKEYDSVNDNMSLLRGKIDIRRSIDHILHQRKMLNCDYDVLSEDNVYNQIIKTTALMLLREANTGFEHKRKLKKLMLFLSSVDELDPKSISWNTLKFQKNNQDYKMLLNICYFVLEGLLLTDEEGHYRLATFLDEQRMCSLYEKFILEYYRYHHPDLKPSSARIDWNTDDGIMEYLPVMQSDIMLTNNRDTLIIDAKYYRQTMSQREPGYKTTLHAHNLYQIYAYVKNSDVTHSGSVSGMLLYAKTDETITPDSDYMVDGNRISAKTLDLGSAFSSIADKLDSFVEHMKQ